MDHHDHSHMHRSDMDHGHGGHGDMGGSDDQCSMSMLFTWDTNNLCIVFRQWHIRSTLSLIVSLLLVVAITAGYEALRAASRRYEMKVNKKVDAMPRQQQIEVTKTAHFIKAALYGVQNFYAFMIMLIFMTYNGWVMIAVGVGAFVGYVLFGNSTTSTKENACH